MASRTHIVIVQDRHAPLDALRHPLEERGHAVTTVTESPTALAQALALAGVVIIDASDLFHAVRLCGEITGQSTVGVILALGAAEVEAAELLRAFDAGATLCVSRAELANRAGHYVDLALGAGGIGSEPGDSSFTLVHRGQEHKIRSSRGCMLEMLLAAHDHLVRSKRESEGLSSVLAEQTRKLRQSDDRYRAVVEHVAEGIYMIDATTRKIVDANASFLELVGYSAEELIGMPFYDIIHASRQSIDARFEQIVHSQEHSFIERQYRRRDGSLVDVEVSAGPVSYGGRKVVCTVVRDVTDRKRAQQQLEQQNRRLQEAANSERLALQSLKQAQSQMVQTEKLVSLGQMVAGVAHEINNPLSFIGNNMAVLQRDLAGVQAVLDLYRAADELIAASPQTISRIDELCKKLDLNYLMPNLLDIIARSREGVRRIRDIVNDLRDFARLDESDISEIDLNAGIESTTHMIHAKATEKNVELQLELAPLPRITCYPAKINQVIMNLLSNAIDASSSGQRVVVRTAIDNAPPASNSAGVRFEVIDQGTGIAPELHNRIFDPFFTTKPLGEGTGLGLSISYGIVEDHGGKIEVESEPGKGARFTVHLPLRPPLKD